MVAFIPLYGIPPHPFHFLYLLSRCHGLSVFIAIQCNLLYLTLRQGMLVIIRHGFILLGYCIIIICAFSYFQRFISENKPVHKIVGFCIRNGFTSIHSWSNIPCFIKLIKIKIKSILGIAL